jgi:hypothetical protein
MPQSKKRKPHHENHPPANTEKSRTNSAVLVSIIFFCLFGMGIAYFAAGSSLLWLVIGGAGGAVAGYFFGHMIDKALSKK